MRYTDQEDGDSEDSQRTRSYDDHQADLVLDEAHWSLMTAERKICAKTGSFTVLRDIEGNPVLLGRVKVPAHRPEADSLIRNTQITIMLTSYART